MKDGLLDLLQGRLSLWGEKLDEVWQLITTPPQAFKGGEVWGVIVSINTAMQGVAYGLLILFFAAGVLQQTTSFQELRRPETVLKLFLRFAIAKGLVTYCMELLLAVMELTQGILYRVISAGGGSLGMEYLTVPDEIAVAIDSVNFLQAFGVSFVVWVGGLVITVLAFILIMTVYGRFFKVYLFTTLAPIPLSTFSGEHLSQTGRQFLKNYAAACLEFAIIAISCIIVSKLIGAPSVINAGDSPMAQVWGYLEEVLFNMLLLVGTIKMCDRLAQQIFGM